MRRVLTIALLSASVVALPASTAAAKPKPKPATFKVGTYKATPKAGMPFTITLKRAKCAGKLQLCVSLPTSPGVPCMGPVLVELPIANFSTPVALPSSGKVTQHGAITAAPAVPGETTPSTGQSAFSVTFTKKGTASGYLEESLVQTVQGTQIPCSGKAPFTAKLG